MRSLVGAELVAGVVRGYVDRVADAARRLGCPPGATAEVVERGGYALVEMSARLPEQVVDLAGRWFADTRTLVAQLRLVTPGAAGTVGSADTAVPEAAALEAALAALDERRRFALLLRDSYDLPPLAVAVALGLSTVDAATVVAEARLRLLEQRDGVAAPSLARHPALAGLSVGTLGSLSDGSAEEGDPQLTARRRHVGTCVVCAGVLDAQTRARTALAGLTVLALPDDERDLVVARITDRAAAALPTAEEVLLAAERPERAVGPLAVTLALALAALLGVAVGAVTADRGTPTAGRAAPVTAPASPTDAASPEDSPSPSESPTPSPSPSPTPSVAPVPSASPTPSPSPTSRPSPSPSRRPRPTPLRTTPPAPPAAPTTPVAASTVPPPPATTAAPPPTTAAPTPPAPATAVSLSPTSGPAGTTVSVTGTGFTPSTLVTVTYDGTTTVAQALSRADGSVSATFTVPAAGPGPHPVTASDGSRTASTSFAQTA